MKIKRLIIRNIASIEQGEIDFENGLTDRETGLPASLFLITGDTGSGKSVILDCISMSLYGTTPRVKSVNGLRHNAYRNNDGENIAINDIAQYTRIGISWKDDCYSELHFTGNDGIDYISRFSLGRTNRRNYRKPEWKLLIGTSEIIDNRKEEIRARIQEAVGLSFDQFSRMAMLAQGQFATFLTGKKEEREIILEQLTSTEIFSQYGEAISRIYKGAKQDYETCKTVVEEISKKILDDATRHDLTAEQAEKTLTADSLKKDTERIRHRIACTETIIKTDNEIEKLKEEKAKLKEIEDSTEYRQRIRTLTLWDATADQRQLLSDKLKAYEKLKSDRESLKKRKTEYLGLAADLEARMKDAEATSDRLRQLAHWIESQEPHKKLFTEASAVTADIYRFISTGKEISAKEKESGDVVNSIDVLLKSVSSMELMVKEKAGLITECQTLINFKSTERDLLNPVALREESNRIMKRQFDLTDLLRRLNTTASEKHETETAEKETEKISIRKNALSADAEKAAAECSRIETEKNAAENRYRTMLLSVEENFEAIRRQLVEEHADNCPLCGQSIKDHIHAWSSEEYFSGILSPLAKEKDKLNEAFSMAKKAVDQAMKELNTTAGRLKAMEADLKKRKDSLSASEGGIKELLKRLGMEPSEDLKDDIADEISRLKAEMEEVSKKLNLADMLQKEIDSLIRRKASLDKDHKSEEGKLQKELESLAQKREALKSAQQRISELKKELNSSKTQISDSLKGYADNWTENPEDAAVKLKKDADRYASNTSIYAKEEPEHRSRLKALQSIDAVSNELSALLAPLQSIDTPSEPDQLKRLKTDDIQKKWHEFHIGVSSTYSRIADNESKMKDLEVRLNEYYQASGTSETTLKQLLGATDEIMRMRTIQEKHRDAVQKNSTLLEEAGKNREENLKALGIEDESSLDDIEVLRDALHKTAESLSAATLRLGAIREKLETDAKTLLDSETQRSNLERKRERMEKWETMQNYFGGTRFRTLVQSHILRPLLNNANIYLRQITDHYTLTCSDENEQLSILVLDRYHNNEPRSVTVLSGGERFMISLALSLALSAMNRPDMNVDILFIDEGFGTLDAKSLEMVMSTLRRLPEINGQSGRRVGVISHREELTEQIPTQIQLRRCGEGRSRIVIP